MITDYLFLSLVGDVLWTLEEIPEYMEQHYDR